MAVFLRVDINVMAILLLGATYLIARKRLDKKDTLNKAFLRVSLILMLELFIEMMTCIINRQDAAWLIPFAVLLHIVLYSISPLLTYFWYLLVRQLVKTDQKMSKRFCRIFFCPALFSIIITLLSPIFHFVFYISRDNIYHRGPLFLLTEGSIYFYVICSCIMIIRNRRKLIKEDYMIILMVNILPVIGGIIQMLFYGPLLMLSCAAFSLVITYNFLQQRMIQLDALTGAWNRGSFDYYIANRFRQGSNEKLGIVFFDLDKLKYINDSYGHLEGDLAIKTSIDLIKSVIRKKDILIRMGGDEFIIIMDYESKEEIDRAVERIYQAFAQYNEASEKSYKLECSFGADIFDPGYGSIEQFLSHVDKLMYQNKREKYKQGEYIAAER